MMDELSVAWGLTAASWGIDIRGDSKPSGVPAKREEEGSQGKEATGEAAFQSIVRILDENKIDYNVTTHRPTKTSQESADVRGVTLASGAKAMLMKGAKSHPFVLFVLSAAKRLDWKKLRKHPDLGRGLKLADNQDLASVTGCIPGAVPPFGSLFPGVVTFVDDSLIAQGPSINFNAGLQTHSIAMSTDDYLAVEKPIRGDFTS